MTTRAQLEALIDRDRDQVILLAPHDFYALRENFSAQNGRVYFRLPGATVGSVYTVGFRVLVGIMWPAGTGLGSGDTLTVAEARPASVSNLEEPWGVRLPDRRLQGDTVTILRAIEGFSGIGPYGVDPGQYWEFATFQGILPTSQVTDIVPEVVPIMYDWEPIWRRPPVVTRRRDLVPRVQVQRPTFPEEGTPFTSQFTTLQMMALLVLQWFDSESDSDRGTGRTYVVALHNLRRAIEQTGEWVAVRLIHSGDNVVAMHRMIVDLADWLNVAVFVRPRAGVMEVRVVDVPESARHFFESLHSFTVQPGVAQPQPSRPAQEPTPEVQVPSVWERLMEGD